MAGFYDGAGRYYESLEQKQREGDYFRRNWSPTTSLIASSTGQSSFPNYRRDDSGRPLGNTPR